MPYSFKSFLKIIGTSILLIPLLGHSSSWQQFNDELKQADDPIGTEYYTISEPEDDPISFDQNVKTLFLPLTPISNLFELDPSSKNEQNLLQWVYHKSTSVENPEKYQRKTHFGTWIKDPSQQTCLNVRGLVLLRDSAGEITYADDKHCRITGAHWVDPYTNKDLYSAEDIQIDHMVPLKNAYVSGAWKWNYAKRCTYANFLGNKFHLLPVFGSENNRKSDSSPETYVPPNKDYVCQYLVNWLKIKSIWQLKLSRKEALGIEEIVTRYQCDLSTFEMTPENLKEQRTLSTTFPQNCLKAVSN